MASTSVLSAQPSAEAEGSRGAAPVNPGPSPRRRGLLRRRFGPPPIRSFVQVRGLGLVYILVCLTVGIAATNTGNNALFLVMALMLGVLAFSGWASRWNVRGLDFLLEAPPELFAGRLATLRFTAKNRSRWLPRWLLLVQAVPAHSRQGQSLLPFLPRSGKGQGRLELLPRRRGLLRIEGVRVESAFPFGLFAKAKLFRQPLEILIYPAIFDASPHQPQASGRWGDEESQRRGHGHGLYQLRPYQDGDDPRRIHWKRSARTEGVIVKDLEDERTHRVSILLDNALQTGGLQTGGFQQDEPSPSNPGAAASSAAAASHALASALKRFEKDEALQERFEKLVSEAATAVLDFLDHGFEVELVTRDRRFAYASGRGHRSALLEHLALLQPEAGGGALRAGDPQAPRVRLALEGGA
ncbi:MAG: DUF58 domain-containing protein [Acidobacteriota bacterium]